MKKNISSQVLIILDILYKVRFKVQKDSTTKTNKSASKHFKIIKKRGSVIASL